MNYLFDDSVSERAIEYVIRLESDKTRYLDNRMRWVNIDHARRFHSMTAAMLFVLNMGIDPNSCTVESI